MTATTGLDDALAAARGGATVVTATRRLARSLRERYDAAEAARGRAAWMAPSILPWPAWLGTLWEDLLFSGAAGCAGVRLSAEHECAVWERVIARAPDADPLLSAAATATAAAEAWTLMHAWRLSEPELRAHAADDTLAFLDWAREFECLCSTEGWIDQARLPDYLAPHLASMRLPGAVVFAGFDEFTPQQSEFLDACRASGVEAIVAAPAVRPPAHAVRAAFNSRAEEIESASRWARRLLETGATRIGVVVPDLHARRAAVERVFARMLDPGSVLPGADEAPRLFNISAGRALSSYPAVHAALLALELNPDANDTAVAGRMLLSPFLAGAQEEWTRRAALDARLRRYSGTQVTAGRLEHLCVQHDCPTLARALGDWRSARETAPARQGASDWARTFSLLLARLGWPNGRPLASADYQSVAEWRELLSSFEALDTVLPPLTCGEALARLRRLADQRMFQPEGAAAPVQILGTLETPGLTFDHLWIAGLDDEAWPPAPHPAAFLPVALQRARNLPHASPEREFAFAKRITARLTGSAPDVVVSYPAKEDDRELGPSPLIRSIATGTPDAPPYPAYLDVVRDSSLIESLADHAGPVFDGAKASGGTKVFQHQATCPFRAFAELRLGARPLEAPEPGLNAMERGTLVHDAMARIWNELQTHARLCSSTPEELSGTVRTAVAGAVENIAGRRGGSLSPRFAELEATRLERILAEWLDGEKLRQPFRVVAFERAREATAGGVSCDVKVDRIDRLEDGRDVIIDYKTGRPTARSWTGERPDEPQLPLYAVTHDGTVAAVLFGQIKAGEIGFRGFAADDGIAPGAKVLDLRAEVETWRNVLDRLGTDFRNGVALVNPKNAASCRRCSLVALCRFGEAEAPTSAFDGGDANA